MSWCSRLGFSALGIACSNVLGESFFFRRLGSLELAGAFICFAFYITNLLGHHLLGGPSGFVMGSLTQSYSVIDFKVSPPFNLILVMKPAGTSVRGSNCRICSSCGSKLVLKQFPTSMMETSLTFYWFWRAIAVVVGLHVVSHGRISVSFIIFEVILDAYCFCHD